ncbi:MAG: NADH-quinone oxidoreductase subunit L [Parachlamydiales bacterium]|jgi:NADH-quinone oxidoreductase subunit L
MQNILLPLGLFLPLIGSLIIFISSKNIGRKLTGLIGCTSIFLAFACFSTLLIQFLSQGTIEETVHLYEWINVKGLEAGFTLHLDHLSLWMSMIITGVGFLIHVYSNGYMDHEKDYARFFAYLNFFVFAMLLLVLASNLLLLFVGWEGVGLASYLLIGFWYEKPSAASAATKAFVVNRIGDLGLLLGILLTFALFGTSEISTINTLAGQQFAVGAPIIVLLTLLYFVGATGKSAQIPLHTWLPDAMEGPTPVSALIHAATMVTAGVYLVVRLHPIFLLAPTTMQIVAIIGAATSLYAALSAIGQTDLKRVLAYSTVSQLGLMFLACGVGAFYAAIFHLTTHAFIKALLFLSAGNVVHMAHDMTDMQRMGGFSKVFPKTYWLFLIGVLALSGIPPLAAFFSKDLILELTHLSGNHILYFVGLAASTLTGFYLIRAFCLTFTGTPRLEEKEFNSIKEAPTVMLAPVSILAILSVFGGLLGFAFGKIPFLENFLIDVGITPSEQGLSSGLHFSPALIMAIAGAFLGVGTSWYIYTHYKDHPIQIFRKSFYVDTIYWNGIVRPLRYIASLITSFFEPKIFDGMISGTGHSAQFIAAKLQKFQSGQLRSYVAWMVVGSVFLLFYLIH